MSVRGRDNSFVIQKSSPELISHAMMKYFFSVLPVMFRSHDSLHWFSTDAWEQKCLSQMGAFYGISKHSGPSQTWRAGKLAACVLARRGVWSSRLSAASCPVMRKEKKKNLFFSIAWFFRQEQISAWKCDKARIKDGSISAGSCQGKGCKKYVYISKHITKCHPIFCGWSGDAYGS